MLAATRFLLFCAAVLAPALFCLAFSLPEAISQTACKRTWDPITCGDVLFIGVHGSIEGPDSTNRDLNPFPPVIVETCEAFEKQALETSRKIDVELLDYTAPTWEGWLGSSKDILNALPIMDTGRNELDLSIQNALTHCPVREIVLAGYSFGAWIIDDWLSRPENSADLPRIRAVQLYGDPLWHRFDPISKSVHEGLARRAGQAVSPDPYTSNPIGPPGLADRWESFCLQMDPVCGEGFPHPPISLEFQLFAASTCTDTETLCEHLRYARNPDQKHVGKGYGVTEGGGQFLAAKAFPLAGSAAIVRVDTSREGDLVFFSLLYTDPSNEVAGFGFRGAKGAGWAEERHTFGDSSYARVSPGRIEYPFNHLCESGPAYESDVEAWLQNSAGNQITPTVMVHLACSAPMFVILGPHPSGESAM